MMVDIQAYFITPENTYVTGNGKHINIILDNPELFGLTSEYIHQLYEKYDEKIGFEGKARNVIMSDLLKKDWIRVRIREGTGGLELLFQVGEDKEILRERMRSCITRELIPKKIVDENTLVIIRDINEGEFSEKYLTVKLFCK